MENGTPPSSNGFLFLRKKFFYVSDLRNVVDIVLNEAVEHEPVIEVA